MPEDSDDQAERFVPLDDQLPTRLARNSPAALPSGAADLHVPGRDHLATRLHA